MTNPSPASAHAAARGRIHPQDVPPLQWWRGDEAPELSNEAAIAELRTALGCIAVLGLPDRRAAAEGGDAAAIDIALRIAKRPDAPAWLLDWAGSALLLSTMQGSLAAAVALDYLRRRHVALSTAEDGRA